VKIYNSITRDIETGEIEAEDSYEYEGPIADCNGTTAAMIIAGILSTAASMYQQSMQPGPAGALGQRMPQKPLLPDPVPGPGLTPSPPPDFTPPAPVGISQQGQADWTDWEQLFAMIARQSMSSQLGQMGGSPLWQQMVGGQQMMGGQQLTSQQTAGALF